MEEWGGVGIKSSSSADANAGAATTCLLVLVQVTMISTWSISDHDSFAKARTSSPTTCDCPMHCLNQPRDANRAREHCPSRTVPNDQRSQSSFYQSIYINSTSWSRSNVGCEVLNLIFTIERHRTSVFYLEDGLLICVSLFFICLQLYVSGHCCSTHCCSMPAPLGK